MTLESTCSEFTSTITTWSENEVDLVTDLSNNHRDTMYINEDILSEQIEREKLLVDVINNNSLTNERYSIEIEEANNMITSLSIKNEILPKQMINISNNIDIKIDINNNKLKELNLLKSSLSYRTNEFNKSFDLYRKYLGLDFIVLDNKLYFQFTKLNKYNPKQIYSFAVYVNENELYQIEKCEPMISYLSTLVDVLNTTNDFSKFVRLMRKEFVNIVNNKMEGDAEGVNNA